MTTQSKQTTQQHTAGERKTMASLVKPGRKDVVEWTADGKWRVVAMGLSDHEATMLAAAPDMLDVCKQLVWADEHGDHEEWAAVVAAARAAIAKAMGAQS